MSHRGYRVLPFTGESELPSNTVGQSHLQPMVLMLYNSVLVGVTVVSTLLYTSEVVLYILYYCTPQLTEARAASVLVPPVRGQKAVAVSLAIGHSTLSWIGCIHDLF
jgi:hypothetical protein